MDWIFPVAERVGSAGLIFTLAALWLQHIGLWFPHHHVKQLQGQIDHLSGELKTEREEREEEQQRHREELKQWEQRTFNALGVADRISRVTEDQVLGRRPRPSRTERTGTDV